MELDTLNGAGPCNSNPLELTIIIEREVPEAIPSNCFCKLTRDAVST